VVLLTFDVWLASSQVEFNGLDLGEGAVLMVLICVAIRPVKLIGRHTPKTLEELTNRN
jgi:hypothetical protein